MTQARTALQKCGCVARSALVVAAVAATMGFGTAQAADKPNVVVLMTDDVGWSDFGYISGGGAALGHATPSIDRMAKEGTYFTSWYGQASCTAGRTSFMTGRIPIRTAMSIVVVPGDENMIRKETPTIAEFFKKNGYQTYYSGKWHMGDKPEAYPIEHGFDEMKHFGAYYPGVYTYSDTSNDFHPWFPSYNKKYAEEYFSAVNMYEWEGVAGQPAKKVAEFSWAHLAEFDVRQTDSAVAYIQKHAKDAKPFFMDINFMKMHNPNNPAKAFVGKSKLGRYSDAMLELDSNIGRVMDAIRKEAPNTIVVLTSDNGAWQDAYPDSGTTPFRGDKSSAFEAGWRVPGVMWWPGQIPSGVVLNEMMSHIDLWSTLATMSGLKAPPVGEMLDNAGKPIYFDSIDNSAWILGKAKHSARNMWVYIDGESFMGVRVDMGDDPANPDLKIAWKYLYTAKDTWLGPEMNLGAQGAVYNLTMDPFEKYDMLFNGAMSTRQPTNSPGRWSGQDNGWVLSLAYLAMMDFNKSIIKYPNTRRFPGGDSNDLVPNLKNPDNPVPAMRDGREIKVKAAGG
ncbi:MAG: arylsulfatase [Burkholderiales bacterium]